MRRLNLVLLASLQLCAARQPGFSIHEDLLAHPQFEVVFSDDFISEADALAILDSSRTGDAALSQSSVAKARESAPAEIPGKTDGHSNGDNDDDAPVSETYELINSAPWRYLCSVPVIAPPPVLNRTATELAKAEEARELSRASAKGWELMSGLDGHCMYFVSGWWSYSFCYGKSVVQFHAMPGRPGEPPVKEEKSLEYVLGRAPKPPNSQTTTETPEGDGQTKSLTPPNAQLQIKGDQRYLSQRLEGGTICDLTGRPRTIEIQYHCSPGATADRIGWVKEVTTCTYLMVVYTPRLCHDVAFQPPKETRAHPIRCRQILSTEDEENTWRYNKMVAAGELLGQKPKSTASHHSAAGKDRPPNYLTGVTLGGVLVGAKKHVSDEIAARLLPLPPGVARPREQLQHPLNPVVEVLASKKKDAGTVEVLNDDQLKKLNLDPKAVAEFREKMERLAGERGWKLQVVEVAGGEYEYVGAFDDEEEGAVGGAAAGGGAAADGGEQRKQAFQQKGGKAEQKTPGKEAAKEDEEEQEGSQEVFFKEEL